MNNIEKNQFRNFKESILNFEKEVINIDELYMLINRATYEGGRFSYGYLSTGNANRLRYYRYWIKMLENQTLIPTDYSQVWLIKKE